jgi:beta-N-acetylglucosaminidase
MVLNIKGICMAEKLDPKEIVSFKELLMANSIQVDAIAQLLIEKGIITNEEFFAKLKQVQSEYKSNIKTDD